jgi:Fe-S cluster biogenesis protein NfuA/nitrite reductase/ring-hydroxylating ferredoxin subunit
MLALIDALHRNGLEDLVELIKSQNAPTFDKALQNPAIKLLFTLYDLIPLNPKEQVENALLDVMPYIRSHGGELEILEVQDGTVHLSMGGACQGCGGSASTLKNVIEATLAENFSGFKGIVTHEPATTSKRKRIPLHPAFRPLNRPVFSEVGTIADFPGGSLRAVELEEVRILLCHLEGEVYAYRNGCPGSILPLENGKLENFVLHCPWHGCRYDLRNGRGLDKQSGNLEVVPVAVQGGVIQVAVNVAPVPLAAETVV